MVYVGLFSFDELGDDPRFWHFTCLVESETLEKTIEIFRSLLTKMRATGETFQEKIDIFIDGIIEAKRIPRDGVLTRYT